MADHPQYAMWKARYEGELAVECERAERRGARDAQREAWQNAWHEYKEHWREGLVPSQLPPWWHLGAWVRLLLGKAKPGRSEK